MTTTAVLCHVFRVSILADCSITTAQQKGSISLDTKPNRMQRVRLDVISVQQLSCVTSSESRMQRVRLDVISVQQLSCVTCSESVFLQTEASL
ncbi:hypothetical protein J6590_078744 [Homalodisca vitripennis]|nr:hypothetical protein J6590_078744 [Homalodisca vitripennis]